MAPHLVSHHVLMTQLRYMQLRNSPSAQGQHVEFTLQTQSVIIAKYGFEPSLRGVMEMRFQSRVLVFDVARASATRSLLGLHALV